MGYSRIFFFLGSIISPILTLGQASSENSSKEKYSPFYLKTTFDPKSDLDSNIVIPKLKTAEVGRILQKMLVADQRYRDSLMTKTLKQEEVYYFNRLIIGNDKTNQALLSKIIARYGWPADHQLGEGASDAAWLVLWHASRDYKKRYFNLVEHAYNKGHVSKAHYTTLKTKLSEN
ncbi:hypothetical protein [Dyadobacter sp. 50-39]|uniref:hypothetical protein n=1 Tax=Dyadobacter sp. 50-39 TaxID=1895756 RepID=UPI0025C2D2E7|nr:hypothetical protein [Dyadobacter sp. 50-39]